jgi:hypothetical protein
VDEVVTAFQTEVLRVPPGEFRDYIHEVTVFDNESGGKVVGTYETSELVETVDSPLRLPVP